MTDPSYVLVDSHIIIDIVQQDARWLQWSTETLAQQTGAKVNPIIYAEICYQKTSAEETNQLLDSLSLGYAELPREALYLASQAFRLYRQHGGPRTAPLPDFFIGAHAASAGIPILTRDTSRYQSYFPKVRLISPSAK